MPIKTTNDLVIGNEYFIRLTKTTTKTIKVRFLAAYLPKERVNTNNLDYYFKYLERKGYKDGISFFGIDEIGIGSTRDEALKNYAKIPNEKPENYTIVEPNFYKHEI
jgi:hypothetical protein